MSKKVVSALVMFETEPTGNIILSLASRHMNYEKTQHVKSVQVTLPEAGCQDQIGQITGYEIGKPAMDILTLREALNWLYGLEA